MPMIPWFVGVGGGGGNLRLVVNGLGHRWRLERVQEPHKEPRLWWSNARRWLCDCVE